MKDPWDRAVAAHARGGGGSVGGETKYGGVRERMLNRFDVSSVARASNQEVLKGQSPAARKKGVQGKKKSRANKQTKQGRFRERNPQETAKWSSRRGSTRLKHTGETV